VRFSANTESSAWFSGSNRNKNFFKQKIKTQLNKMKKIFSLAILLLATATFSLAQRFAYVDTDYILGNMKEYTDAQKQLDAISADWQKQIDDKYKEIDGLYKQYQAEQVLLTDDMKKQRQKEIEDKEKEVKDFQKAKFGYQGELYTKRQELVKPIQDKAYDAVKAVAVAKGFDFVFDKASGSSMLYVNTKYDLSDDVLKQLGITPTTKTGAPSPNNNTNDNGGNK